MRIGIDASCWANPRGYGRFTRELCGALVAAAPEHAFTFFADERAAKVFELDAPNAHLQVVSVKKSPTQAASADSHRSPLDMLRMTRAVRRVPLDVFFSPSVYTFFPLPLGLPTVVTLHDAIAERFPELTLPTRRARFFWKAKVGFAVRQARVVLTVSEFSKRDLIRVLGISPRRIRVTTEAPAEAYRPSSVAEITAAARRAGLLPRSRWFVYVGGFNPHKNVDVLVRAHARVAERMGRHAPHLLLVGTLSQDVFHGDQGRILSVIEECGTGALVHWTGFLADEELRHLHSGAAALVLPSQCEGFGLPAIEAAACGAPVVATTESPLPELLEGGGRFVAPRDQAALEAALFELASDRELRDRLGERALARTRNMNWASGAHSTLAALSEAAR